MEIGIIGGGASGFFAGISAKVHHPDAEVKILEKGPKVLAKVKITGGGRCNVTNACDTIDEFCAAFPRGGRGLKKAFHLFSNKDTVKWFESRGVPLVTQPDNCIFPEAQDSQVVINCLINECKKLGITILTGHRIQKLEQENQNWRCDVVTKDSNKQFTFDKVIVTTGGSPTRKGLEWLAELGHKIEPPVPSLFTFNMPHEKITELMGIVVENTLVNIPGTKLKAGGPLLITHWGMSGPAILKLSAFGARIFNDKNYQFTVQVNWVNEINTSIVAQDIEGIIKEHPQKILQNIRPYDLPSRLWLYLLNKTDLSTQKKWDELGKKGKNKLVNILTNDIYNINGKSTFKEEFVTCGGVSLKHIKLSSMESKVCPNLYFAGEVADIDAITGGYNLQGAWTTGFLAGKLL